MWPCSHDCRSYQSRQCVASVTGECSGSSNMDYFIKLAQTDSGCSSPELWTEAWGMYVVGSDGRALEVGGTVLWRIKKKLELMAVLNFCSPQLTFSEKERNLYTFWYSPPPNSPFCDPHLPPPPSAPCCYLHWSRRKFLACNFTQLIDLSLSFTFLSPTVYHTYICMDACVKKQP